MSLIPFLTRFDTIGMPRKKALWTEEARAEGERRGSGFRLTPRRRPERSEGRRPQEHSQRGGGARGEARPPPWNGNGGGVTSVKWIHFATLRLPYLRSKSLLLLNGAQNICAPFTGLPVKVTKVEPKQGKPRPPAFFGRAKPRELVPVGNVPSGFLTMPLWRMTRQPGVRGAEPPRFFLRPAERAGDPYNQKGPISFFSPDGINAIAKKIGL